MAKSTKEKAGSTMSLREMISEPPYSLSPEQPGLAAPARVKPADPSFTRSAQVSLVMIWLAAAVSWIWTIVKFSREGGGDLLPVWQASTFFLHHQNPYGVVTINGGFVYPPSDLVLLAPLGLLPFAAAKLIVLVFSAAALLIAGWVFLKILGRDPRFVENAPFALPLLVLGLALFFPDRNGLWLGNIGVLIVVGEALFVLAAAKGRWVLAGGYLGLTLAVKPILVPLLLVLVLSRKPRAVIVALIIPAFISIVALVGAGDPVRFLSVAVPYIFHGAAAEWGGGVALTGAGASLGLPEPIVLGARVLAALVVGWLVFDRLRSSTVDDGIRLLELSGLLMLGTFLTFSYSFSHYILLLLPLLILASHPGSIMRSWLVWPAVVLLGAPMVRSLPWWFGSFRLTVGLLLLLLAMIVGMRHLRSKDEAPVSPAIPADALQPAGSSRL